MKKHIENFISSLTSVMASPVAIEQTLGLRNFLLSSQNRRGRLWFLGNGASASISTTLAFKCAAEQKLPALAIVEPNLMLGAARKSSFAEWMAKSLPVIASNEDVIVLTSSSGESPNVVDLAGWAKSVGIKTFSLTGFEHDNTLSRLSNEHLWVDSLNYNVVESAHLILGLAAARGLGMSESESRRDVIAIVDELSNFIWEKSLESLAELAEYLANFDFLNNRILFTGDGSSSALASHMATDFCKSGLLASSLNDLNFLSASQNDFGSEEWLKVGVERQLRPSDLLVHISHADIFPAEVRAVSFAAERGNPVIHAGSESMPVEIPDLKEILTDFRHPVLQLVGPSLGLLGIAEAFLELGFPTLR